MAKGLPTSDWKSLSSILMMGARSANDKEEYLKTD